MTPHHPIVGIGASAGGVEALEQFFKAVPADSGMAFVVVTHLSPSHESMLAEILGRATEMPVFYARDGELVQPQQVHVLPPSATLTIREGRLRLRLTEAADRERTPIDVFFNSLAEDQGEHAIGVVLSGGGSDGTLGLKAIKENGGLTVAQGSNLTRPRFAEMPSSAVAAGFVDLLLPVEDIPERVLSYVRNWGAFDPERPVDALADIHRLLRERTGHDFSDYKDRTFQRRVQRRMQVVQTTKLENYVERLRTDPEEVGALFRDLLIGVTNFFRDSAAFRALETLVIPRLFEDKAADDEVRVWVAGCSTGEEAYSTAILLREHMDRLQVVPKVKIFATDIDETAMKTARSARYPGNSVKEVAPERLKRFFVHEADSYRLAKDLRDMCIFSTHSVIRDPPFSRLDLISCRNLLIYLKPGLQAQIIPLFHYSCGRAAISFSAFRRTSAIQRSVPFARQEEPRLPTPRSCRTSPHTASAIPASRAAGRKRVGGQPGRSVATFQPTAEGGQYRRRAFCAGLCHRQRIRRGALLLGGHGKIFAGRGRTTDARCRRDGAPGSARRFTRGTPPRQAIRPAGHARPRPRSRPNDGVEMISLAVAPISEANEIAYGVVFIDRGSRPNAGRERCAAHPAAEDSNVQQIERELQETKERLQSTIEELETANEEFRSPMKSCSRSTRSSNRPTRSSKPPRRSCNRPTRNCRLSTTSSGTRSTSWTAPIAI